MRYEYSCSKCGKTHALSFPMSMDNEERKLNTPDCDECNGKLFRVYTVPYFREKADHMAKEIERETKRYKKQGLL